MRGSKLSARVACAVLTGLIIPCGACSSGPSKAQAIEAIRYGVKEDGSCTLPLDVLTKLKMQHNSKGVCIPKEGAEKAQACISALIAANVTRRMPDGYMVAWPDEVSTASLRDIPAYERRARNAMYSTCVELTAGLREGRFTCSEAHADKVLKVSLVDATHANVHYAREVVLQSSLSAIDAACGAVTRPPAEATVPFVKGSAGWTLASTPDGVIAP